MRLVVETEGNKEKALIVSKKDTSFTRLLKKHLKKNDIDVDTTALIPYSYKDISYMFILQDGYTKKELSQLFTSSPCKIAIISEHSKIFNEVQKLIEINGVSHIKALRVLEEETDEETIEKVLWFMLRTTSESSLNLVRTLQPSKHTNKEPKKHIPTIKLTKKRAYIATTLAVLLLHTLFLIPLSLTAVLTYASARSLQDQNFEAAQKKLSHAETSFAFAQGSYALAKPGLQFLFLSVLPNNLISTEQHALKLIRTSISTAIETQRLTELFLKTNKSPQEIEEARSISSNLRNETQELADTGSILYDLLAIDHPTADSIRTKLALFNENMQTAAALGKNIDVLIGSPDSKKYVVFFYNNMELRPGGGFIGSFATITTSNYTLQSFDVYDVYDADGQLTTHVRPPAAIREYMDQPNWFLRDSNFSPDFQENVNAAEFFLEKELGFTGFDGAFALTTTALTYMLEAFDELYIADFDETITADNFYFKAQTASEKDFFEGSAQKKNFLSTVGRTLMLKLSTADPARLALALKRSLDEKHLVMTVKEPKTQNQFEVLGWSGRVINPQCVDTTSQCILNHILSIDANLGVNKANYFVSKSMKLNTVFTKDGIPQNELNISYTNTSSENVFPGGVYKNYMQVYIPSDIRLKDVFIDGVRTSEFEVKTSGLFTIVSLLVEVPEETTRVVSIQYNLRELLRKGQNSYQIVFQKQIGAFNNDFSLEIVYPDSVLLTDQNFESVAKNHSVFYNSNLATNKVFILEFLKE